MSPAAPGAAVERSAQGAHDFFLVIRLRRSPRGPPAEVFEARKKREVSDLFELEQTAVEVFGVQEEDRFAMGADLWLAGAQDTGAG